MWKKQPSLSGLLFHSLFRDFFPEDSEGEAGEGGRGERPPERQAVQDNTERKTAGTGEEGKMESVGGAEIWFNGTMERGQVDDFVIVWADRGRSKIIC